MNYSELFEMNINLVQWIRSYTGLRNDVRYLYFTYFSFPRKKNIFSIWNLDTAFELAGCMFLYSQKLWQTL